MLFSCQKETTEHPQEQSPAGHENGWWDLRRQTNAVSLD